MFAVMERTASTSQSYSDVLSLLVPALPDAPRAAVEKFGQILLARASEDYFEGRDPRLLAADIDRLYTLLDKMPPDGIDVAGSYDPDSPRRATLVTVMADCPFIVETLREFLHGEGLAIEHMLHPVMVVDRDDDGRILQIRDRSAEGRRTSVVYASLTGDFDSGRIAALEAEIRHRLELVAASTADFHPMLNKCRELVADLEADKKRFPWRVSEFEEIQELLSWLQDGNFVFLGFREYRVRKDEDTGQDVIAVERTGGLGIMRDATSSRYFEPAPVSEMPTDLRARLLAGPLLIVSKTNALSAVHRRARMDDLAIKKIGPDGETLAERRFLGLFTAKAFSQDAAAIPILRRKLREILDAEQADKGSHDYGLIVGIFNSLPKEDLFLAPVSGLIETIETVIARETSGDVMLFARPDDLGRGVHAMVILPKEKFSGEVRRHIQEVLTDAYEGTLLNYHLALGEGDQARLHFHLASDLEEVGVVDLEPLESRVRESVRSWDERLLDGLEKRYGAEEGRVLAARYDGAFSPEYRAATRASTVVKDVERLEELDRTGELQVVFADLESGRPDSWYLNIFAPYGLLVLSDVIPVLENVGFRVIESEAYEVRREGAGSGRTIHSFIVEIPGGWEFDGESAQARVQSLFNAVRQGRADDVDLNRLILSAGLDWRQVALLKAYASYAFHIGAVPTPAGSRRPLIEYPDIARVLHDLFCARHDPALEDGRDARVRRLAREFRNRLESVRGIDDDLALRRLQNLVFATVRTNYFQSRAVARPTGVISLKLDCGNIESMPRPTPKFEIYVSSASTEGAHLRMDDVARGGIRWSDRTMDFRVEVLGLVKTQQVKNAVIVPAGAKGAYVVKRPPAEREAFREAGVASYKDFIRGLLDLTDNLRDGQLIHPPETVIYDDDDPYLVVAADKGTATLSDTANALAAEYELWLGDAFASGGSNGYDHKKHGITARGAWECVKRHFREMGTDIQEEEFTAVGVGDMSGDVFGNGVLLSRKIRLLAAFDHRHIFIDPNPDPETSWEERKRLFDLPRSSWEDYDPGLISEGGDVFERGAKKIPLSPAVREALGIEEQELNGNALIQAILKAPVDLLWNGGIGTYVKASDETNLEVGDPGNNAVRVDGSDLRVRVVGEGGNLGFTQAARIEYARAGGRLNTDALDNSAGVDMSDHEVNIKIILHTAIERGELDASERDRILQDVVDRVTDDVLSNNYTQSLAVSLDEHRVQRRPEAFRDTLAELERSGILDRAMEGLASTDELLEREAAEEPALVRPELAVLLAYAKMHLKEQIAASGLADDPALMHLVRESLPGPVVEAGTDRLLEEDRLRTRFVGTVLTNLLVDTMGGSGHLQLMRETGRSAADVAKGWYIAYRISDAATLMDRIREFDNRVPAAIQTRWILRISATLGNITQLLVARSPEEWDVGDTLDTLAGPVARLREALGQLASVERRTEIEARATLYETDGLDAETARMLVSFEFLDLLIPVAWLARELGKDPVLVGRIYFGISEAIDFKWLVEQLERIPANLWEQRAARVMALDLAAARIRMVQRLIGEVDSARDLEAIVAGLSERLPSELKRVHQILDELKEMERPTLPALMVAVHAIAFPTIPRANRRS
jgi:glutamate dehydrogenase